MRSLHQNGGDSIKRKRGRPSKISEQERDWTDEELFKLIHLWSTHECLYNTKSPEFLKRHKRSVAINDLVQEFQGVGKPPSPFQVQLKLTRLRCYYTAENNKVEKSRKESGGNSIYVPGWKFFESLHFLRDCVVFRSIKSEKGETNSTDKTSDPPPACELYNNSPSLQPHREIPKPNQAANNNDNIVRKTVTTIRPLSEEFGSFRSDRSVMENEDKKLSDMIYTMLQTIPEGRAKALLRLELQQKIIQVKFDKPACATIAINNY